MYFRKGARTTPLVTIAVTNLVVNVLRRNGFTGAIFTSFCGGDEIGQAMATDRRISLVSFSGTSKVFDCSSNSYTLQRKCTYYVKSYSKDVMLWMTIFL